MEINFNEKAKEALKDLVNQSSEEYIRIKGILWMWKTWI